MLAAGGPSRTPLPRPSDLYHPSSLGPQRQASYADSAVDPNERLSSLTASDSAVDGAVSEFGQLSVHEAVDASYDWRSSYMPPPLPEHRSSLSVNSAVHSPTSSTRSAPKPSTASIPLPATNTSNGDASGRPAPPPRRATSGLFMAPASSNGLQPSLYGGNLPPGMTHRSDAVDPLTNAVERTTATARSGQQRGMEEDDLVDQSGDGEGDFDDGASDYCDAESIFSHVTYATLPSYESSAPSPRPPVPPIPAPYALASLYGSAPPSSASLQCPSAPYASHQQSSQAFSLHTSPVSPTSSHPYANATGSPPSPTEEEFHGFRPRNVSSSTHLTRPTTRTVYSAPSPYATASTPAYQSYSLPSASSTGPYRPIIPQSQLQPHSYVLGPNGQPIPVYAAAAPSAPPTEHHPYGVASPHLRVQTASQAASYSSRPALSPTTTIENPYSVSQQSLHPSAVVPTVDSSPSASSSPHSHSPATSTTISFHSPSLSGPPLHRPTSAASSSESIKSTATTATFLRSGMSTLRSLGKNSSRRGGPMVRFQSPAPDAKSRGEKGKGGKVGGGGGEMKSVFEDSEEEKGGGGVRGLTIEQKMAKQKKALEFSMAMLQ